MIIFYILAALLVGAALGYGIGFVRGFRLGQFDERARAALRRRIRGLQ